MNHLCQISADFLPCKTAREIIAPLTSVYENILISDYSEYPGISHYLCMHKKICSVASCSTGIGRDWLCFPLFQKPCGWLKHPGGSRESPVPQGQWCSVTLVQVPGSQPHRDTGRKRQRISGAGMALDLPPPVQPLSRTCGDISDN